MINNQDFTHYSQQLAKNSRVQIPNFLQPPIAEKLYRCLLNEVPWDIAYFEQQGKTLRAQEVAKMTPERLQQLYRSCRDKPEAEYCYWYHTFMMVTAYIEKREPNLLLHPFLEFLNSPQYLDLMKAITQDASIRKINAQATLYQAGDFLREHNDSHVEEGRKFAYVLNLTKNWDKEWGGLLVFNDQNGHIVDTFVPQFNSLNIFKVPQNHLVTCVSNETSDSRLAITGWMLDK